jgi:hypothetical protein
LESLKSDLNLREDALRVKYADELETDPVKKYLLEYPFDTTQSSMFKVRDIVETTNKMRIRDL